MSWPSEILSLDLMRSAITSEAVLAIFVEQKEVCTVSFWDGIIRFKAKGKRLIMRMNNLILLDPVQLQIYYVRKNIRSRSSR